MRVYPALVIRPAERAADFSDIAAALFDDFGVIALEEIEEGAALRAFFSDAASRDSAADAARRSLTGAAVDALDVPDENWAERSQASLTAVRVGALTIAPPWDAAGAPPDRTVIILPSMGFGTGHHATTRLCLRALQEVGVRGRSVIDVGTGSGVLGLAAMRLGASRVTAIDNDPDAVTNARENASLNQLPLDVECVDLDLTVADEMFDVAVANLTGATLVRFAKQLETFAPDGTLIVSGLREEEEPDVRTAFSKRFAMGYTQEGWRCLVLR